MPIYYDDDSGRRIHRSLKRSDPPTEDMPDAKTAALIREAIGKYPKATAEEVCAFVEIIDRGPKFEVKAVRAVMHFG